MTRFGWRVCAAAMAVTFVVPQVAAADPSDLQSTMASLEQASRDAEAKNEELLKTESDLQAKEKDVQALQNQVAQAKQRADATREALRGNQQDVDMLAQSKYRGSNVDPLTTIVGAQNPQNAIDRSAYISSLADRSQRTITDLQNVAADAGRAQDEAARAQAQAQFQAGEIKIHRDQVAQQRDEMKKKMDELKAKVDSLNAEQRAAWEGKNKPIANSDVPKIIQGTAGAAQAALSKVGAPYVWGATGPDEFDCSGLMLWAYAQQGKSIPRTSQAQLSGGTPVSLDALQPGDIIGYYPGVTHVGMYIGDGKIVHASDYGIPVQVISMNSMPIQGAVRY